MTAKEKGKKLVDNYINIDYGNVDFYDLDLNYLSDIMHYDPRKHALIAIDELLLLITYQPTIDYWNEVKQEIEKL